MRALRPLALAVSTSLLSGCWFLMEPPPTPTVAGPQQATVVTTPAAPKPPPEPNADEMIGADADTNNPEVFRALTPGMSRKQVDAYFPGTARDGDGSFVMVPSKIESVEYFRFYFSDDGLYTAEAHFPPATSTEAVFAKLVAAGNAKWGAGDVNDARAKWERATLTRTKEGIVLDVHIDIHRGKAAPFDVAGFVGKGDAGSPPAAFADYPKTLSKDDAKKLGLIEPSATQSFVNVIPAEGSQFHEVEIYYGDYATPRSVTIILPPSQSNRTSFLALKTAMEKRYGKGRVSPKGATDADLEGVDWKSPRMSMDLKAKNIEIELRYNN